MNWQCDGYLISKNKFRENSIIANFFTNEYGKVGGIIYGGNSRKIKNYLQNSNLLHLIFNSKGQNKPGYFKVEIITPNAVKYFDDKERTIALNSLTSLLNIFLPEYQPYKKIFTAVDNLIKNLDHPNWVYYYLKIELLILSEIGYGINIENVENLTNDSKNKNLTVDQIKYQIPDYLIQTNNNIQLSNQEIKDGLVFLKQFMLHKFFIPNRATLPAARNVLEKYF